MIFLRCGAVGLLLSVGVLFQAPLHDYWVQNPVVLTNLLPLYGYPGLSGLCLIFLGERHFQGRGNKLMILSHGAALVGILWLVLWCFVWLAMMANLGESSEMVIKHTAYLHLFGVGFSMAGYAAGWLARPMGERSARFLGAVGWAASYMAWFNLYLQPTLTFFWAPAVGGLLVVLGAFLIQRALKRAVESPT
jgi:hypothetical protein